jgi:hypothetical protein
MMPQTMQGGKNTVIAGTKGSKRKRFLRQSAAVMLATGLHASPAVPQELDQTQAHLSFSGMPGHVEMPSARSLPDATLGVTTATTWCFRHRPACHSPFATAI